MGQEQGEGRILVVDDDRDYCDTLADLLDAYGYHVDCVNSGQEALDYLKTHPPLSVVLLDWAMPGMTGEVVLREMLQDERLKCLPVVIVTGCQDARGPVPGVYPILLKPSGLEDLLAVIEPHAGPPSEPSV